MTENARGLNLFCGCRGCVPLLNPALCPGVGYTSSPPRESVWRRSGDTPRFVFLCCDLKTASLKILRPELL